MGRGQWRRALRVRMHPLVQRLHATGGSRWRGGLAQHLVRHAHGLGEVVIPCT